MQKNEIFMQRREIKKNGRRMMKSHYILLVFLMLIMSLFGSEFTLSTLGWEVFSVFAPKEKKESTEDDPGNILQADNIITADEVYNVIIEGQVDKGLSIADLLSQKMVDDSKWYFVFWTATENIARYEKGNSLSLIIDKGEINATITDIAEDGDMWRITASSNNYYKDLPRYICKDAVIVSSRSSGLIIDNEYMTTRKGKPGVMVRQKTGDYEFVPVNVEASDGTQSVVSESYFYDEKGKMINTVQVYDEILKDPGEGN